MRPLTKTEFAKERQVSRARVYQWLDDGRIHALEDGRIDADEANRLLDERLDQAKGMRRDGNITSTAPTDASAAAELPLDDPDTSAAGAQPPSAPGKPGSTPRGDDYWTYKTREAKAAAELREMESARRQGEATDALVVRQERIATARAVRNALVAMVDRVAPVVDPANPARAHKLLMSEVHKALAALREDFDERAAEALSQADERTLALQ